MDFNTSSGLSDPVFGAKINGNDVLLQVRLGLILYYQLSNNLSTMNDFSLPSSADFKERRKSLRNSALWNNSKSISLIQVRKIYPTEELRVKKIIEYRSVFAVVNSTSAAVKIGSKNKRGLWFKSCTGLNFSCIYNQRRLSLSSLGKFRRLVR